MIITVTMNPAIDKTIMINKLTQGGLNRISEVIIDAGGKGINVSKTIKELGGESIAIGFLGISGSQVILDCLTQFGIKHDFILVDGETRVNTKVAEKDGTVTELNEKGPKITKDQEKQLIDKLLSYASKNSLFVLAGNIPEGINKDIYGVITKAVKKKGSKVLLDADGELFQNAIETLPDIIKPNHIELAQYFHCNHEANEEELIAFGKQLIEKGIELVVISRGEKGALFINKEHVISSNRISVKVCSTVGAGDAMVAALCYAIQLGMSLTEGYKLSIATATGAVMTSGTKPPSRENVEILKKQVDLKILE